MICYFRQTFFFLLHILQFSDGDVSLSTMSFKNHFCVVEYFFEGFAVKQAPKMLVKGRRMMTIAK